MYELFVRGYIDKKVENGYMILGLDDEIDGMKRANIDTIKGKIKENIDYLEPGIQNILISKNYERIADNITNLAEALVYIHKGEDLRHKRGEELKK
jgi:phosphate uptake regulator